MFNTSKASYDIGSDAVFYGLPDGRYTRLNEEQVHADHPRLILVSPELSQVNRVQILHFPSDRPDDVVRPGHTVDFRIVKNGAHGIVTVHVIAPSGAAKQRRTKCDVIELSADSYAAYVPVTEAGVYSVHVRFNDVEVPRSPLTFHSVAPAANE